MSVHPVETLVHGADTAINQRQFEPLMAFYAENAALVIQPGMTVTGRDAIRRAFAAIDQYFNQSLQVTQLALQVIEGADTALVIAKTRVTATRANSTPYDQTRKSTYVFARQPDGKWRCTVDNSYGTALLD